MEKPSIVLARPEPTKKYDRTVIDRLLNEGGSDFDALTLDLHGCDLKHVDFRNACVGVVRTWETYFEQCNFSSAQFVNFWLFRAKFVDCNLFDSYMVDGHIADCEFLNFSFKNADFTCTSFKNVKMQNVSFEGAILIDTLFENCDLREVNISCAADVRSICFVNCLLSGEV